MSGNGEGLAQTPRNVSGTQVLATSQAFWNHGQHAIRKLEQAGCAVVRPPRFARYDSDELIGLLENCDAVLASSERYDARVFAACSRLKVVSRVGVGYDAVDVPAATQAGVVCTNTPGAMVDAVADFTIGLMVACARRLLELDRIVHEGGWAELSGVLVSGKTLGLVGYGQIGQAVARRALGFSMRVLAYDPLLTGPVEPPAVMVDLERLIRESDFVSVHAPASAATRGMFGAAQFAAMKPTAFFINTARGSLVDEPALIEALESGKIAGAALDVTCHEPLPPDDPLRRAPRLVLTAHNAFNAAECVSRMCMMAAENVLAVLSGDIPPYVLNPEVFESPQLRIARGREN